MSQSLLAALLVGGGLGLVIYSLLLRTRRKDEELAKILDLPFGEDDVPVEVVAERAALIESTVSVAGRVVDQFDSGHRLATRLEQAQIPMRPGEYVVVTGLAAAAAGVILAAITTRGVFALVGAGVVVLAARSLPEYRLRARRRAFSNQLPDALALIAGSLSAGHTFLRAIQMMTEEAEAPLSEEFGRVVHETRLGDPIVDALDRMAIRLELRDLIWVVQAIRIQQTVGGKLADILHTLAEFMRAREEIRREILVLTAEGRISAWVLAAMPVFLLVAIQVLSPGYMDPLFTGAGLLVLAGTAGAVAAGTAMILRMVKIEI